ncbi:hypothetical protein [Occallatibacter savannae]|uniref:hypothetical protein n=1 Tax=Occallatibacter savannae TaxID=1002691 RepID=UPI0013A5B465|nr:hypothetical protein [Occallatibacter savannae]
MPFESLQEAVAELDEYDPKKRRKAHGLPADGSSLVGSVSAWYPVRPSPSHLRLRQWAFERTSLRQGNTARLKRSGWRERRLSEADSRQVRVLDFERAFSRLDPIHQQVLVLTYRDGVRHRDSARVLGMSERNV